MASLLNTSSTGINVTYAAPLAVITINIPERLNALTTELYRELGGHLRDIAEKDDVTVTVITGVGRFFSAGADFQAMPTGEYESERELWMSRFVQNNLDMTKAFYEHPKILVVALNGPAIGLSAAFVGHADFVYCTPNTFLLTPFTSLGLVSEGGSSFTFVRRLGLSKANEALLLSKKIPASELHSCGFVNAILPEENFHENVVNKVKEDFGPHLNHDSILRVKKLIRQQFNKGLHENNVEEVYGGLERFMAHIPQEEFAKMKRGEKRHKL